jgi:predicted membrane-bound spermidine synthase
MMATADFGVRLGSLISVSIFLLPPIFCMGMVSPIIIQLINQSQENAGQTAGTIYAISTVGGILATFLAGFVLIPELGIRTTAIITGLTLLVISVIGMFFNKQRIPAILTLGCFIFAVPIAYAKGEIKDPAVKVQYQSSGILGEWTVVDHVAVAQNGQRFTTRQLLLNGVDQTFTRVGNEPVSMWVYPHKLSALSSIKPTNSRALLLGMGGGSIAHNLIQLGFELDIVELDERVPFIAKAWFGYDPNTSNLVIDDARHFIRNTNEKYDLVILDVVNGEVQPSHVFTQEGLTELKSVLNDDALVIVNFQGRFDVETPELSLGSRSVFKTFESVGYSMFVAKRGEGDSKSTSADLLMYGTPGSLDFNESLKDTLRYNDLFPSHKFLAVDFTPVSNYYLSDAQVMTDDKPNLELLNASTVLDWRKKKIEYTVNGLLKKGVPIY